MAVHVARPRLKVEVLPFLSSISSRQNYLSADERLAFRNPIALPENSFSDINIKDDLDAPSFSLTCPNGAHKSFRTNSLSVRLRTLLSEGSILRIYDGELLLFCGYITGISFSGSPMEGGADLQVSGGSIEEAIKLQTVYIDTAGRPSDNAVKQTPDRVAGSVRGSLSISISSLIGAAREFKSPSAVISALMDWSITNLLDLGRYGGLKFSEILSFGQTLSQDSYTSNFLHVLNFIQDARIGGRINYWELANGFAQEPLYELFTQYADRVYLGTREQNRELRDPALVFRKTPWLHLNNPPLADPSLVLRLSPSQIIGDSLSSSVSNILTGVHVSLSVLDQSTGLLLNPVSYSPTLLEQYGQRVMPVYLSGVKFENDQSKNRALKTSLQELQNSLFDIFVKTPRSVTGSLMTHYMPEIKKGMILVLDEAVYRSRGTLSLYDPVFYVQGVERSFRAQSGEIGQTVSVKWGRYRE